jgi:uncharacterized membrane protein YfcA
MAWLVIVGGVAALCLYEWFRKRDDDEPTRARVIFVILFGAAVGTAGAQGVDLKWITLAFAVVLAYTVYDSLHKRSQRRTTSGSGASL